MTSAILRKANKHSGERPQEKKPKLGFFAAGSFRRYLTFLADVSMMLVVLPFAVLAIIGIFTLAALGEFFLSLSAWATHRSKTKHSNTADIKSEGSSHGSS